jgi:hypothetical protein
MFQDGTGAAHGGSGIVPMLSHLITGTGYHETGAGRDIEGILPIAAGSYNIDGFVSGEINGNGTLYQSAPESQEFVDGDGTQRIGGQEGGHLCLSIAMLTDAAQYVMGLIHGECFVLKEFFKNSFHERRVSIGGCFMI